MDTTSPIWNISTTPTLTTIITTATLIPNVSQPLEPGFFPALNLTFPAAVASSGISSSSSSSGSSGNSRYSIPEDVLFKQKLQRYAYGYVMLVLCGTGLVGNLLTLAVLSRRTMRSSHTVAYLRSLAVVDACVLLLAVFRYRSYYILLSEREVIRVIVCFDRYVQVYVVPFFWISLAVSSYIVLSLSLERYLVIRWPFTLRKTRWVMVVRAGTGVAVAGIFLVTLPVLLCYRMQRTTFRGLQVAAVQVSDRYLPDPRAYLYVYNHDVIPLAWYAGPWLLMAIVNALLFRQVQKSSRMRVGVPNSLNPNRNLSLLIILIVGVYMICNLPRCLVALYCLAEHCSSSSDGEDTGGGSRIFLLLRVVADLLNVLNSALNILVYSFTGTKFRREVKGLLLCRWWCHNAVTPVTHQSVHVSLREVPATPLDSPNSFRNLSFQDLHLPHLPSTRFLTPTHSGPCPDLPHVTLSSSCPHSSWLHDSSDSSPSSAVSSTAAAASASTAASTAASGTATTASSTAASTAVASASATLLSSSSSSGSSSSSFTGVHGDLDGAQGKESANECQTLPCGEQGSVEDEGHLGVLHSGRGISRGKAAASSLGKGSGNPVFVVTSSFKRTVV